MVSKTIETFLKIREGKNTQIRSNPVTIDEFRMVGVYFTYDKRDYVDTVTQRRLDCFDNEKQLYFYNWFLENIEGAYNYEYKHPHDIVFYFQTESDAVKFKLTW